MLNHSKANVVAQEISLNNRYKNTRHAAGESSVLTSSLSRGKRIVDIMWGIAAALIRQVTVTVAFAGCLEFRIYTCWPRSHFMIQMCVRSSETKSQTDTQMLHIYQIMLLVFWDIVLNQFM